MADGAVLVTGAAGFIGAELALRLLGTGREVVGLDNLVPYYDPALKRARLERMSAHEAFRFVEADIADRTALEDVFAGHRFERVVHMAAQAGVRHSIENPHVYGSANLTGFLNVIECCRQAGTGHLVYASSSSVYGGNETVPFSVSQSVDHPVSLYAATKKANELMAHAYAALYGLPATGLRFFTVYGPWGRPDMAYWSFTEKILAGRPIPVFNNGAMERDFTYVDDVTEAVARLVDMPPAPDPLFDRKAPDPGRSWAPHRVLNVGNRRAEPLMEMIAALEAACGRKAEIEFRPMQPGDVRATWADVGELEALTGFRPDTPLADGLARFVAWYREWTGA